MKIFIPHTSLNNKNIVEATESEEELLSLLDNTIYTAEEISDSLTSVTNSLELVYTATEELTIESYKEALDSLGLSTENIPTTISTEDLKSVMEKVITGIKLYGLAQQKDMHIHLVKKIVIINMLLTKNNKQLQLQLILKKLQQSKEQTLLIKILRELM